MKYAILVSEKDIAGMNIKERLLEMDVGKLKNTFLHMIKDDTIYSDGLDKKIDAEVFIFATRHKAKAGIKTLTCHTPGNFGKAEFGGKERKLCIAYANLMKTAYLKLKENAKKDNISYEVSLECTHHGPYIEKPCMFIEIGSTEEEWKDKKAGETIAKTIIDIVSGSMNNSKSVIGIGGTHYCENFNKVMERTGFAVGHICPKYALENLDEEMLKQMIEKNKEKIELAILDWKGLGTEKQRVVGILEKIGIKYQRSDKINIKYN
jgi:D-aminoacyl-tRNA deacylase